MSNQIVTQLKVLVCRKQVTILNPEVPNVMNHKSSLKWEQTYQFFVFEYVQISKQFGVVNLHSLMTIRSPLLHSTSLFRNILYIGFDVLLKHNACLKGSLISGNIE